MNDYIETRRIRGATVVLLEGGGLGLELFRGGPAEAKVFRRNLVGILRRVRAGSL